MDDLERCFSTCSIDVGEKRFVPDPGDIQASLLIYSHGCGAVGTSLKDPSIITDNDRRREGLSMILGPGHHGLFNIFGQDFSPCDVDCTVVSGFDMSTAAKTGLVNEFYVCCDIQFFIE